MNKNSKKVWIINNQLGRRNLTPEQISYLRGKRYIAEKKEKIDNLIQNASIDQNDLSINSIVSTASKLAEEYKVGEATIKRDGQFARAVDKLSEIQPNIRTDLTSHQNDEKSSTAQRYARSNAIVLFLCDP